LSILRLGEEWFVRYFLKAKINTLKINFYMPSNNNQKEYIDIPKYEQKVFNAKVQSLYNYAIVSTE